MAQKFYSPRGFVLIGMGLGTVLACLSFLLSRNTPPLPISDYPLVRHIKAEDWAELVASGGLPGSGWVLLPTAPEGSPYRSGVAAETKGFLKPAVCGECHAEKYESFRETAHARTSSEPGLNTILGSFEPGQNQLVTANPELWFDMTHTTNAFFQELHVRSDADEFLHRRRIDLVIGSGNHGQSYAYWDSDRLYQLHASYLTELNQWVNSPGMYMDGTADFARPVTGRCLECHATWFGQARGTLNRFDREGSILGVTCVRCHGPGDRHTAHHRQFPNSAVGRDITNPAALSRERKNDLCAQCHSAGEPLGQPFTYTPGEDLKNYLALELSGDDPANEDPHSANQLARLMKSPCYQQDQSMTCVSCHDPHRHERGQTAEFSRRCLTCHQPDHCGEHIRLGTALETRCVDCHMPSRRDSQVAVEIKSQTVTALVRDHYISVWPSISERIRNEILASLSLPDGSPLPETKPPVQTKISE